MSSIITTLSEIGFSQKEAQLYIACLESPQPNITTIAQKANIKRSTAYTVIKKLIDKEIISPKLHGKTRLYHPIPPKELLSKYERRFMSLKTTLPELEAKIHNNTPTKNLILDTADAIEWISNEKQKKIKIHLVSNSPQEQDSILNLLTTKNPGVSIALHTTGTTKSLIASKDLLSKKNIHTTMLSPQHPFINTILIASNSRLALIDTKTNTATCIKNQEMCRLITAILLSN